MPTSSRDRQMAVYAIAAVFNDCPSMPEVIHRWTISGAHALTQHIRAKGGKRWQHAPQLAEVFATHRERELAQVLARLGVLLRQGVGAEDLCRFIQTTLEA